MVRVYVGDEGVSDDARCKALCRGRHRWKWVLHFPICHAMLCWMEVGAACPRCHTMCTVGLMIQVHATKCA